MEDREKINRALITVYDDNTISLIPSCDCGETKGAYLLHMKCDKCSTTVRNPHEKTDPLIWLHKLDEMPKFLSPHFWLMMRNVMGKKIDAMRWLSDTSYNPPDVPDFLKIIQASFEGFERSYPHLISNIVNILNFLKNQSSFKTKRKAEIINGLIELYIKNEEILYSTWLPMVNKKLFIMENTSKGRYTDLGIADVIDTTLQFIKTVNEPKLTYNKKSNCMARTISDLTTIYNYYYKEYLSSKLGIFRKHLYGCRAHWTARAVIVSLSGPHEHDEMHLPWCIGVTLLRAHIINLLAKRYGYSYKEINHKLQRAVSNYDKEIDECLETLLVESNGKIPVLLQRNPSLKVGSSIKVYVTKFKKEVRDFTFSISILITSLMNADFDGDELNLTLLIDNNMSNLAENFNPIYSVPGLNTPYEISGLLNIPKPTVATISNFLTHVDDGIKTNSILNEINMVEVEV